VNLGGCEKWGRDEKEFPMFSEVTDDTNPLVDDADESDDVVDDTVEADEDEEAGPPFVAGKGPKRARRLLRAKLKIGLVQLGIFTTIFALKSKAAFAPILDHPGLHYTLFPIAAITDIGFAVAATFEFFQHKNKNLGAYLNLLTMWTKAILATIAVTGALAAASVFAVATPAMFIGVIGLAFVHSAVNLVQNLHQWWTHKDDPELSKHYRKEVLNHTVNTALTAVALAGIAVLMLNPATAPAVALGMGITAAVVCGVVLLKAAYNLYQSYKTKKANNTPNTNVTTDDTVAADVSATTDATVTTDAAVTTDGPPTVRAQKPSSRLASFGFFSYWHREDYSQKISRRDDIRKVAEDTIASLRKQNKTAPRRADKIQLLRDLVRTVYTSDNRKPPEPKINPANEQYEEEYLDREYYARKLTFEKLIDQVISNRYPHAFDSFCRSTSDVQNILIAAAVYDDKVNHKTGSDSSVAKLQEYFGQSADIELEHHYESSLAPAG
jgi:uncharacterized Tic20 family protein